MALKRAARAVPVNETAIRQEGSGGAQQNAARSVLMARSNRASSFCIHRQLCECAPPRAHCRAAQLCVVTRSQVRLVASKAAEASHSALTL